MINLFNALAGFLVGFFFGWQGVVSMFIGAAMLGISLLLYFHGEHRSKVKR